MRRGPRRGSRGGDDRPSRGRRSTIEGGGQGSRVAGSRVRAIQSERVGGRWRWKKETCGARPGMMRRSSSPAAEGGRGDNVIIVGWCTKPFQHGANTCPRDGRETRLPKSGPPREKEPFRRPPGRVGRCGAGAAADSTEQEPNDDRQQMHSFTRSQTSFGCCCQVSSRLIQIRSQSRSELSLG